MKKDVDIAGMDFANPVATDAYDCAKRCDSLPKCKAWVFNPADRKCWMKYAVPPERPRPGLWSGVKDCASDDTFGK